MSVTNLPIVFSRQIQDNPSDCFVLVTPIPSYHMKLESVDLIFKLDVKHYVSTYKLVDILTPNACFYIPSCVNVPGSLSNDCNRVVCVIWVWEVRTLYSNLEYSTEQRII